MDVRELVTTHYGAGDLSEAILEALATCRRGRGAPRRPTTCSRSTSSTPAASPSARYAIERLEIGPGTRLLDVGCGIGGPSRLAATYDAQVTGVDLTPEFVDAATTLTERVGLSETATFVATPGETLPFGDGSFDAALMVHVGMNIPDKLALFTRGPPGAGTRWTVRRLRPDAHGRRSAPLPDAVGRGPPFVVRGDRQRVHRPPGHRGLHRDGGRGPDRVDPGTLHRTARCRR